MKSCFHGACNDLGRFLAGECVMPINAEWHNAHKMPKNPSVDQRVAWHVEHAKHCACREMTPKIKEMIATHAAAPKARKRCAPKTTAPR